MGFTGYIVDHLTIGSQFPLGPADGAQHFRTDANPRGWFVWDDGRQKWLSMETYAFDATFNVSDTVGQSVAWTIPVDGTIVGLYAYKRDTSASVTFQAGGGGGPTIQIAAAKQTKFDITNPNQDIAAGNDLVIQITVGTLTAGGWCRAVMKRRLS
jgi:hypothetical protein